MQLTPLATGVTSLHLWRKTSTIEVVSNLIPSRQKNRNAKYLRSHNSNHMSVHTCWHSLEWRYGCCCFMLPYYNTHSTAMSRDKRGSSFNFSFSTAVKPLLILVSFSNYSFNTLFQTLSSSTPPHRGTHQRLCSHWLGGKLWALGELCVNTEVCNKLMPSPVSRARLMLLNLSKRLGVVSEVHPTNELTVGLRLHR